MPMQMTARAIRAMQGMDCMTLATPMTILAAARFRVMSTPSGMPTAREISSASVVALMWLSSCSSSSGHLRAKRSRNFSGENVMLTTR